MDPFVLLFPNGFILDKIELLLGDFHGFSGKDLLGVFGAEVGVVALLLTALPLLVECSYGLGAEVGGVLGEYVVVFFLLNSAMGVTLAPLLLNGFVFDESMELRVGDFHGFVLVGAFLAGALFMGRLVGLFGPLL